MGAAPHPTHAAAGLGHGSKSPIRWAFRVPLHLHMSTSKVFSAWEMSRPAQPMIAAALTALLCVACASSGSNFRESALVDLVPGKTTEADAISILGGKPEQRIQNSDGSCLLVWAHATVVFSSVQSKAVSILFDPSGVMIGIHKAVNVVLPPGKQVAQRGRRLGIYCTSQLPSGDFSPIIASIQQGSLAAAAGWLVGDIVVAVDGSPVGTMTEVILATDKGGPSKVYTLRRGEHVFESRVQFPGADG